ncbi:helix-turn-helix domain-containing protein [Streptomyces chattanoogensis]
MADGPTGSTVPRRQLGRYLRDLRNEARLTVRSAARKLERAEATIWRIETGQTSLRSLDVEAMCKIYGAPDELTEALVALAKETKAKGWWHAYGDAIPEGFDLYIGLEEAAAQLDWYEGELIPGLLQTKGYARTIISAGHPDEGADEIERRVNLRIARHKLISRATDPPTLNVALNEAVLRRPIGGHTVMAPQLTHLLEASGLPNVTIRVVPFSAGLNFGVLTGPFTVLRFPVNRDGKPTEPPTVYSDGFTGALYLDKEREIQRYTTAFQDIWNTALDEKASQDLISETAGNYEQR